MIITSFTLFFLDFFIYTLCSQWLSSSLLFLFIMQHLYVIDGSISTSVQAITWSLLLIEYGFIHGRFGLSLMYLIPLAFGIRFCSSLILKGRLLLVPLFLALTLGIEHYVVVPGILGHNSSFMQTTWLFFSTLGIGSLIILGVPSNRSMLHL